MNKLRENLEAMNYDDLVDLRVTLADALMTERKTSDPEIVKLYNDSLPFGAVHKSELNEDDLMKFIENVIVTIVVSGKGTEK